MSMNWKLRSKEVAFVGKSDLIRCFGRIIRLAEMEKVTPIKVFYIYMKCLKILLRDNLIRNPNGLVLRIRNFGNFCIFPVVSRRGRNIRNGTPFDAGAGYRIFFRPSKNFKEMIKETRNVSAKTQV